MENNLVSVVIPVYNSGRFLADALDSVLNQTYQNIEVIAVDDGSTDDSPEILKQYADKISIISQKNHGLFSALDSGLREISGSWLKWFSPDDIMYPSAIEELVCKSAKMTHDCIIYSDWNIIDENNKVLRRFYESDDNLDPFDFGVRLLDNQQININTSLIPVRLVDRCRFRNLDDPVTIDYDFFLRSALHFDVKFFHIPKPLIGYRIHKSQLSHQNITKTLSCISDIKEEILSGLDEESRRQYRDALRLYQQQKPLSKKTMAAGLKTASLLLPDKITDKLIMIYLNKIRQSR